MQADENGTCADDAADALRGARHAVGRLRPIGVRGTVAALSGARLDVIGLGHNAAFGERLLIDTPGRRVNAEIVGFQGRSAQAAAFEDLGAVAPGASAWIAPIRPGLAPGQDWLGRVLDPLGRPLDDRPPPLPGPRLRPSRAPAPDPAGRARLGPRLDLGIRALNAFATCREGQRMGIFAGSGVGKSTLLSMLTRYTACDVAVIALVGERGREVREFIEDDLGRDGLARATVVVATSDTPPLMRREAAYAATAIAEHFRDQGLSVLLLMDSVTRFCAALREIGLSAGEPPATRGYPPSVFAELPRLLERAGPGPVRSDGTAGRITGLYTVLVEGDDQNEPIADAVRGILDGHVVLDRAIAEGGRYPAIDVLRSLSRATPGCNSPEETALVRRARSVLSLHASMADMIRLGAYRAGTDPDVDEAVALAPRIEAMLRQDRHERTGIGDSFAALGAALAGGGDGG